MISFKFNFLVKFTAFLLLSSFATNAQPVTISIETNNNAMVFQTDKTMHLWNTYFGKKMKSAADYAGTPELNHMSINDAGTYNGAYTPAGTWSFNEPALQVTHPDGNPSLDLLYVSHQVTK